MIKLDEADAKWVDQTLGRLDLRGKLGQLLIPRITGAEVSERGAGEYVRRYRLGGGHAFGGDLTATRALIRQAQDAAEVPLLISGDLERGVGQRIEQGTAFAGQMALGAADDEELAYRFGAAIGREGRAVGYNWVFGPVVDLSIDPNNLSHIRCLGGDPHKVARLASRIVAGIQDHGMAACAKHLPGAGVDDLDSHLTTAINPQSADEWRRLSAVPFQMAIDAGVASIMTAGKACPGIDPECGDPLFPRPIMTSRTVLQDILRGEMGFDGLIVTDALTMGGLTMHYRRLEMHLACLKAGNDMLLFVHRLDSLLDYLEQCVRDGELTEQRIDESVRRVLSLKAWLRLHRKRMSDDDEAAAMLGREEHRADARRQASRAITLVRDRHEHVPLELGAGARVLSVLITNQQRFELATFHDVLKQAGIEVTAEKNPPHETLYEDVEAGRYDAVVVSLYYPPQWGWSTPRCHGPESRCLMDGFPFARADVPPVFISWANPYHLYEFAFMDPYINTYGGDPGTQHACAEALLGRSAIVGRSPVAHAPFFTIGDGLERPARTEAAAG